MATDIPMTMTALLCKPPWPTSSATLQLDATKSVRQALLPAACSSSKVQSLGVCVAALCIWLEPFDIGSTPTVDGEASLLS